MKGLPNQEMREMERYDGLGKHVHVCNVNQTLRQHIQLRRGKDVKQEIIVQYL